MPNIVRTLVRVAAAAMLLVLAACGTIDDIMRSNAKIDYKKGYDFEGIRTVSVSAKPSTEEDTMLLSPAEVERMDLALKRGLEGRGISVTDDPAGADAHVSWHVVAQEQSSLREYNAESYYQCWRCGPAISSQSVVTYTEGTFVVDLIDPELSKSVWRGVMQGRLADVRNADLQQNRFDKAARQMFAKFPPGVLIDGIY